MTNPRPIRLRVCIVIQSDIRKIGFKSLHACHITGMKVKANQVTQSARQLLIVGGLLTIGLAPMLLLLRTPIEDIQLSSLTGEAIAIVLGLILIFAARQTREALLTGVLLALVASSALMVLGGMAGLIGGLFGIVGVLVASVPFLQNYLTWKS